MKPKVYIIIALSNKLHKHIIFLMSRNWNEYNQVLVKRGEILINPYFGPEEKAQGKKKGKPYIYSLDLKSKNMVELVQMAKKEVEDKGPCVENMKKELVFKVGIIYAYVC